MQQNASHFNGPQRNVRPPIPTQASNPGPNDPSVHSRDESLHERPLPRPPPIREEDECPVCHRELPPSGRPDSESRRETHINECIESAFGGHTASPAPAPSTSTASITARAPAQASSSSTVPIPVPIANTPEARTAAREQAHAAVVLGHTHTGTPTRRTGVFPYKASEKDCVTMQNVPFV